VGAPLHTEHRIRLTADDEYTLVQAWKANGDPRVAAQLLAAFGTWLSGKAHQRTRSMPSLFEDVLQEGRIAFLHALQHAPFEPGWRISVCTANHVRKAMRRVVLCNIGTVDFVSKRGRFQRIHGHLARCEHRVRQRLCRDGASFTQADVTRHAAALLGVSVGEIETYRALVHGGVSKDAPVFDDSDAGFELTCPAVPASDTVAHDHDRSKVHAALHRLLPSLHPVERTIVEQRVLLSPPVDRSVLAKSLRMGPDRYNVVEAHVLDTVANAVQTALGLAIEGAQPRPEAPAPGGLYKPRKRRMAHA
jgi:DNA-directed RNA polymerase sigma subunit (sigma70/sigma32)